MKYLLLTLSILLLSSCTQNQIEEIGKKEDTNWHTWNARYVSKTVDGNVTCYSHSEGGIQCFKDNNSEIK